jgi:hypothetical protein
MTKNESEYDSMCLSNFESDINAVRMNRKTSKLHAVFRGGGITTGDEGGIT